MGICDISPTGKLSLQGSGLDVMLGNAFEDTGVGSLSRNRSVVSSTQPAVLARLAYDEVMILTGPNEAPSVAEALEKQAAGCAHAVDVTSALAGIRVAGPRGHLLLAGVTELDVSPQAFPDMRCGQTRVAEIHSVVLRLDLGGLPGYELYFGREFGEYIWDALLEAGEEYEVTPFGVEAMAGLR